MSFACPPTECLSGGRGCGCQPLCQERVRVLPWDPGPLHLHQVPWYAQRCNCVSSLDCWPTLRCVRSDYSASNELSAKCHTHASSHPSACAERDVSMAKELPKQRPYCPAESMDSEDPLFLLYTSGPCCALLTSCCRAQVSTFAAALVSMEPPGACTTHGSVVVTSTLSVVMA